MGGMGNIYTDESLWASADLIRRGWAKSPRRRNSQASGRAVREVLDGSDSTLRVIPSVSDYVDSDGKRGGFQRRHRVYQRNGESASRCGTLTAARLSRDGSSNFPPGAASEHHEAARNETIIAKHRCK